MRLFSGIPALHGAFRTASRALIALALLSSASGQAFAQDLTGWWRVEGERGNEESALYLHLRTEADRPRAAVTIPAAGMIDVPVGAYEVKDGSLLLPGIGWTLTIAEGGRALEGSLPESLVPHRRIAARLERSAAPAPPPTIAAAGPPPAPVWKVSLGAEVWAGLAHDPRRDLLFVGASDGRLSAISTADGARAWSSELKAPIRATPTLRGRRLYVATDRALFALDAGTGRQYWTAPLGAQLGPRLPVSDGKSEWDHYSSSAIVHRGLVLAGSRDGCVYAFDESGGGRRWRTCLGKMVTATPAVSGDAVFVGAFDGRAYALSLADGSERWRYDTRAPLPRDAVVAGRNVLFGSRTYELIALDKRSGKPAWTRYFWYSWIDSPPVVDRGTIFVGSSDALMVQALDAASGRRLWASRLPGWSWARPALTAGSLYAAVAGTRSYIGPRDGALAAIDRGTGALRWLFRPEFSTADAVFGFASSPVTDGGRVYAADLKGTIYAFNDR